MSSEREKDRGDELSAEAVATQDDDDYSLEAWSNWLGGVAKSTLDQVWMSLLLCREQFTFADENNVAQREE